VISKRKIKKSRGNEGAPEEEIVLGDMDLDVNIEDIEFSDEEHRIQESGEVASKLLTQDPILFEEESLTLHSTLFDKSLKKLVMVGESDTS
jgi:hypothetical protein